MALALWALSLLGSTCLGAANIFEYEVGAQPLGPCELRREEAFLKRADYVPQCAEDGSFRTVQCQQDGLSCWCVGADGREVPGSRQPGRPVACTWLQKPTLEHCRILRTNETLRHKRCLAAAVRMGSNTVLTFVL